MRSVVFAAAIALGTSACGSASGLGGAAANVPANARVFLALDTHASTAEWQAADTLLRRFPSYDGLVAKARSEKLGRELDVALLANGRWTLVPPGTVPRSLIQTSAYRTAMATIPADARVRVYTSGAAAPQLLGTLPGRTQVAPTGHLNRGGRVVGIEQFRWGAADVVRASGGLKVEARARASAVATLLQRTPWAQIPVTPYAARLPDEIPADALFVADVPVSTGEFELVDPSALPAPLRQLVTRYPSLPNQLDTILGSETALYLRAGRELTLVTEPPDLENALRALDQVQLGTTKLFHAVLAGELVVSTTQRGIAEFRADGAKLSADPAFRKARLAAGMPAATTGFVYANLAAGPLARALARLAGVALPPTRQTMTAYAGQKGDIASFVVFLQ